jgi:simple sugar transport system ATP-binding protein
MTESIAVEMRGITKAFPGVFANNNVDFEVRAGEIHALVGENGAGKTTLMNLLYGLLHPDQGEILIDGKHAHIGGPRDAIAYGIGMVHQHFMLIPVFTVGENVMLGREPVSGPGFYDHARARNEIAALTKRYSLRLDPDARTGDLPVGLQQRVEIVKVLYRGANIVILDEPTGVLTPQESKELFGVLRDLVKAGKTIIFISHKLREVLEISDRITVMRRGKVVGHLTTKETTEEEIATLMVGREVLLRVDKKPATPGAVTFKVENLTANSDRGVLALNGLSFELREGEILGIAGVEGNGQSELTEVLAGTRRATGGRVLLGNRDVTTFDARTEREAGIAFIPEDRRGAGLVLSYSIAENLILGRQRARQFAWHEFVLLLNAIWNWARRLVIEFDIRTPSISAAVRNLSGGNQQKVIVAREMGTHPKVLIAAQPTRGVDIGAIEFIHRRLVAERDAGTAILLVSAELDEIRSLSDRIAVMYEGRIVSIESPDAPEERLGLLMTGGGAPKTGAA